MKDQLKYIKNLNKLQEMVTMPKIFINPGHAPNGIPDPGAVNAITGLQESDVAAVIGAKIAEYLESAGCQVEVLQSDSLSEICGEANTLLADAFISIHCNSAADTDARGTETWYCHNSDAGAKLAGKIQQQIVNALGTVDRGTKDAEPGRNGLYVLTNTDMPAALVETAFISNSGDEVLLEEEQDVFAAAIARGVTDYFA